MVEPLSPNPLAVDRASELLRRVRLLLLFFVVALVVSGLTAQTNRAYPFLAYGTDWLAFAHLAITALFWGPYRDPVRNSWVLDWGVLACLGVVPLALIAGHVRGIPFWWRLVDCSFALGVIPLLMCRRYTRELERLSLQGGSVAATPSGSPILALLGYPDALTTGPTVPWRRHPLRRGPGAADAHGRSG